jgi:hypothetical protein
MRQAARAITASFSLDALSRDAGEGEGTRR